MNDARQPIDPASSRELNAAIDRIESLDRRHAKAVHFAPTEGSMAKADRLLPHARWVELHSLRGIAVAIDHLRAWRLIVLSKTLPMYAPMTLLRGALEGSARSRWLMDPAASSAERVARGVAMQLDDYRARAVWESSLPRPAEMERGGFAAARRLEALRAARDADAVPEVPFPGPAWIAKHYGIGSDTDRSWPYRLTSAFAHAKEWALLAMTLGEGTVSEEGVRLGTVAPNDAVTSGMTRITVDQVELSLGELETYLGILTSADE